MKLREELETKEAEAKIARVTLETQKSLFPPWSVDKIQKEAIDAPNIYWLEPTISFDLNNEANSQLDFPITPRAFLFRCFGKIEKVVISEKAVN